MKSTIKETKAKPTLGFLYKDMIAFKKLYYICAKNSFGTQPNLDKDGKTFFKQEKGTIPN